MPDSGRRFRLGLFVLGTGALFVGCLVFLLQNSLDRNRATYFILFQENVKGMVVGSKVNFQGVPIGVVADLRFQDGKTLVELRVDPTRASVQDLTRARMDRLLVTGQVTVELEGYGPAGKPLADRSFIEPKEDPLHSLTGSLPQAVDRASDVLGRLDRVLAHAEALLGVGTQQQVAAVLHDVGRAARELAEHAAPEATALLQQARGVVQAAHGTTTAATRAIETLAAVERRLDGLLHEATALVTAVRGPAQTVLAAARTALDDLRGLARQLKHAPDSLLFGLRMPAAPAGDGR